MAKLESSVSLYGDKLELKLYGFNDKLSVLLSKVLAIAKSFSPKDDRFRVCNIVLFIKKDGSRKKKIRIPYPCLQFYVKEKKRCENEFELP